jgi:glycosyltransferase involved in cell wall biosynthesis
MVVLRALATATPVVASDIPAYRAVAVPGTGVLVSPGDAQALAGAIVSVLADDPARERSGAAAREAAGRYAWPKLARELAAYYEHALAGRAD